jgi:riboflavin kinase/FMN adenylyltransferase
MVIDRMNVWYGIESVPADTPPVVATIGNFDGVHLGHQAILLSTVAAAKKRGLASMLLTFDPHPLSVVAPERMPKLLQTRRQKLHVLGESGLDLVVFLRFDASIAALSGDAFFTRILLERIRFSAVHVGRHFRFGRDRAGDVDLLTKIGATHGFVVVGVPQVTAGGETVSSSATRRALDEGDVERARRFLGRPFFLAGEVVRGQGRGRSIEFPTANVQVENELIPKRGVYITETHLLAGKHASITNIGVRPTFGGGALMVETHLLDFEDDVYGEPVEVGFLARLRDEKAFSGPTELADQIARDRAAAYSYFQGLHSYTR